MAWRVSPCSVKDVEEESRRIWSPGALTMRIGDMPMVEKWCSVEEIWIASGCVSVSVGDRSWHVSWVKFSSLVMGSPLCGFDVKGKGFIKQSHRDYPMMILAD